MEAGNPICIKNDFYVTYAGFFGSLLNYIPYVAKTQKKTATFFRVPKKDARVPKKRPTNQSKLILTNHFALFLDFVHNLIFSILVIG